MVHFSHYWSFVRGINRSSMDSFHKEPGSRFDIKMTSYQYRKSHCGDKTILRPPYLHNGIFYTDKTSLYWIGAQVVGLDKLFDKFCQVVISGSDGQMTPTHYRGHVYFYFYKSQSKSPLYFSFSFCYLTTSYGRIYYACQIYMLITSQFTNLPKPASGWWHR